MKKRIIALICLLVMAISLTAVGCQGKVVAYKRGTPLPVNENNFRGLDEDEFFIGGYIGPQDYYAANGYRLPSLLTDEAYAALEEAGINYIVEQRMDVDTEVGQRAMELASRHNINYFINVRSVVPLQADNPVASKEEVKAKMEELLKKPGFGGVYLLDEPSSNLFPILTDAVSVLYELREELGVKDLNGMINGFPNVGWEQLSAGTDPTMNWQKYLDGICETGIDHLAFDYYPFTNVPGEIAAGWLNALGTVNKTAEKYGVPWYGYVQGGGEGYTLGGRIPNEGEINWNIGTMVAMGAKGISYFPLVMPPEYAAADESKVGNEGILTKYGTKTRFFYYAKKINAQLQAMAPVLLHAAHEGVILDNLDSPNVYTGEDLLEEYRCFKGFSGDSALIGCFDYEGTVALVVMNNSIENHHAVITLEFDNNYEYEVTQRTVKNTVSGKEFTLHLEAGEFALVVVQ